MGLGSTVPESSDTGSRRALMQGPIPFNGELSVVDEIQTREKFGGRKWNAQDRLDVLVN